MAGATLPTATLLSLNNNDRSKGTIMSRSSERGAAAVEFAIVVPVLVMLLLGIMEFSRAYNAQASLSAAARESVRVMAISNDPVASRTAAKNTAIALKPSLADSNITFKNLDSGTATCASGTRMKVTITYTLSTMTGIAGPFTMTGQGAMLCGG
ncbi:hypothetical protein StoSoilB19_27870 [Arthrobacter sp. StoSoilB19]|nr:hypothetical protein StoSoilB19_27870 [Arthrobacter sp. StoSoilB19]